MRFRDGGVAKADEAYIRQSILDPAAQVVQGYEPIMPTFKGLVTEEGILDLIEYIKSLGTTEKAGP
ncbi:MAG: cytochrome c [Deltaproteobacteria bacterium]|nr:MAG: cytochrome c [Deltaproteobacteria bacterium]